MAEWIDKARAIDFDRLDMLVSERIGALKMYVENMDKIDGGDTGVNEAICRDLIFPCVGLLANFVDSVNVSSDLAPETDEH